VRQLEFFFDCSSPWTYLAFHRVEDLAAEADARLVWRPILVGGVFNSVNPSVYEQRSKPVPAKARYHAKDLGDWARFYGLRIGFPPVFPVNSVKAMRGAFVAEECGQMSPYARAVFEAYWGDLRDISQDEVLRDVAERVGLDSADFFDKIGSPPYKARLRANTEELIERGGFGSPTLFVDREDMYFGNDRLPLVREALMARPSAV
jgi:2-hydroxychromene-2-carboxylate isomerase